MIIHHKNGEKTKYKQTNSSASLSKQQYNSCKSFRVSIVKNFMRFSMWKLCKIETP